MSGIPTNSILAFSKAMGLVRYGMPPMCCALCSHRAMSVESPEEMGKCELLGIKVLFWCCCDRFERGIELSELSMDSIIGCENEIGVWRTAQLNEIPMDELYSELPEGMRKALGMTRTQHRGV